MAASPVHANVLSGSAFGRDADALVDADELDVRVGLGGLDRVGTGGEADGHDDVVVLVDEGLDVLGDVGRDLADGRLRGRRADLGRPVLGAFPAVLVEVLVIERAHIGDQPDLEVRRGRRRGGRFGRSGRRGRSRCRGCGRGGRARAGAATAGGDEDGQTAEQRQANGTVAHVSSSSFEIDPRRPMALTRGPARSRRTFAPQGDHWRASYRRGSGRARANLKVRVPGRWQMRPLKDRASEPRCAYWPNV